MSSLRQPTALTSTPNPSSLISVSGDFAISSNTCGSSIGAGLTCTVGVTYTPTVVGSEAGTLTINWCVREPHCSGTNGNTHRHGLTSIAVTPANSSTLTVCEVPLLLP
jgi:hypothetical protein